MKGFTGTNGPATASLSRLGCYTTIRRRAHRFLIAVIPIRLLLQLCMSA